MRKIALLTVPLLILGLFSLSADVTTSVSGDATLTWGVDLGTNATGFTNAQTSNLEITIVPEASSATDVPDGDDLYAYINLKDFKWVANGDGTGVTVPSVEAKLVLGAFSITTYSAPTIEVDYVVADNDVTTSYTGNGGLTLSYDLEPLTVSLGVLSADTWVDGANEDNAYAFLGTINLSIGDDASLDASIAYGHEYDSKPVGIGAKATFDLGDVDPHIAFDGSIPDDGSDIPWDVEAGIAWNLSDDETSSFTTVVKMTSASAGDSVVSVSASLTEGAGDEGSLEGLGAGLSIALDDVTGTSSTWTATIDASYLVDGIKPFFEVEISNETDADTSFKAGLELSMVDHLTATIQYESTDISGGTDAGQVTGILKISY